MQKVVIDGANGYVATHFIKDLLAQNYKVIALVRANGAQSAEERMRKVLMEAGASENGFGNLEVYNYSLFHHNFNWQKAEADKIFDRQCDFFHFAASLKFTQKNKKEIFDTNVRGTENAVNVFLNHSKPGSRFFYVGTVYSCGKINEIFRETFYPNQPVGRFRNYYEQSKRYAENVVEQYIREKNLNGHVIRLSQVVGDSRTGETYTDYGVFDFAKRMNAIGRSHPGQTIRLKIDPDGTQNLISINQTIYYLTRLLSMKEVPEVINMVGRNDLTNNQIIESFNSLIPVKMVLDKHLETKSMSALERLIAAGMSFTGMYASNYLHFELVNLNTFFSPNGHEVSEETLKKMMKFFISRLNGTAKIMQRNRAKVKLPNNI